MSKRPTRTSKYWYGSTHNALASSKMSAMWPTASAEALCNAWESTSSSPCLLRRGRLRNHAMRRTRSSARCAGEAKARVRRRTCCLRSASGKNPSVVVVGDAGRPLSATEARASPSATSFADDSTNVVFKYNGPPKYKMGLPFTPPGHYTNTPTTPQNPKRPIAPKVKILTAKKTFFLGLFFKSLDFQHFESL